MKDIIDCSCGHSPVVVTKGVALNVFRYRVVCPYCGEGDIWRNTEQESIQYWNKTHIKGDVLHETN